MSETLTKPCGKAREETQKAHKPFQSSNILPSTETGPEITTSEEVHCLLCLFYPMPGSQGPLQREWVVVVHRKP